MFIGLGYSSLKIQREDLQFGSRLFTVHIVCVVVVVCLGYVTASRGLNAAFSHAAPFALRAALLLGIALLALACVPLRTWIQIVRITNPLWLYACGAGFFAAILRSPLQSLWDGSLIDRGRILQVAVFHSVHAILRLFLPDITVDPASLVIGTPRFAVMIAKACSGMEGLGLMMVFTIAWLLYFRKEVHFLRAILLVPFALGCVWSFNVVRICAIVLIGDAGAPDIAMVGFHSQAGWIAFTLVALAFSMATQRFSWIRKMPRPAAVHTGDPANADVRRVVDETRVAGESPATASYLAPFLAILAASFISRAASGHFEWLYPLRFFAAAVAIWRFRHEYRKLDWHFGWMAPVAGVAIFLVWVAPVLLSNGRSASLLESELMALSPVMRFSWIGFRVAAAVITVPIAEELAFRGYLSRRIISSDFAAVPFSRLTVLSIGLSSAAFGLMYGQHWIVGILAGVAYAVIVKWRGRIGDAVIAHATSNLLLAAWVLVCGDWGLW
ncbi:exosortase E/protease, VPEID-CTERM system [Alloacidobacterium sp.]|uniref:exosortase E/protease, VPEID-CTERM system n=1 Tax=Alloacidobacterium sp. TaxID=2951999 RepID=UPI002D26984A|nr:exosortase E/protease, VPEID-CTERM system [Alloacidobacterium sp.]HYK35661.1 exosortase E/protease, VPEID-CTERM system [Alloacidobacterium sp.]